MKDAHHLLIWFYNNNGHLTSVRHYSDNGWQSDENRTMMATKRRAECATDMAWERAKSAQLETEKTQLRQQMK